ncbi:MAG: molybdopterin-dependent oxidoreductase [Chromatiales bacterium]|nr:molybdopterin-dependent oxidoreductase [Chromatiales bacterium]
MSEPSTWVGQAVARVEDATLLRGQGQFIDDLGAPPGTVHAAFVRSPHAHARIVAIDVDAASSLPGVEAVLVGQDLAALGKPFITGVKVDAPQFALAIDRVRYVGEPVAIVVAADRYLAEDGADQVLVQYAPLTAVIDPQSAVGDAPLLHPNTKSNVLHERRFAYGNPEQTFASADALVETTVRYPRNACTPIECCCVEARHDAGADMFDILANFQGPYTLHTVMARSLGVPGNRLRLRTPPDSGGSFGVKQAVFPYVVAIGLAAKLTGRPVKWLEDRLEHLTSATSATNRVTHLRGAFRADGTLIGLDFDQLEDCGAFLRAPEPATLYRMHGNMTGAYQVANLAIRNRVVVTNKTPTGLNRGFGGPQVYFALERLMDRAAEQLSFDPFELRLRNLVPGEAMPYRSAPGALLDSGNYAQSTRRAMRDGGLERLRARRAEARAQGRLYGIGCAAVVEPSISNMGYITALLTPEQRERSGAKNGALATATVSVDPSGSVSVHAASIPQGQGHRTVLAQVVADVLGLHPTDIVVVMDHDTGKDSWSIASGNYSSRFAGVVAGAAHKAALTLRERIAIIAAGDLNTPPADLEFVGGSVRSKANPDNTVALGRTAAKAHWSPLSIPSQAGGGLRETATWSLPELTEPDMDDRVNSSGAYGFIFDFCGVEICPDTGAVRIDNYVTMHDAGTLLNPPLADGQIRGGFAHGLGAALLEEFIYDDDGSFLSGNFADYLPPTANEIPPITILHDCSPSPFTPLGAKGVGEGNCMSTPVCIANAVADAIGRNVTTLPLNASRVMELLDLAEPPPPTADPSEKTTVLAHHPQMSGGGEKLLRASTVSVWSAITQPEGICRLLPGCNHMDTDETGHFIANVVLGVGPVSGRFSVRLRLEDMEPQRQVRIIGEAQGPLGTSSGWALVQLQHGDIDTTQVRYTYGVHLSGKIAAVGGRLLDGATRTLIGQLLTRLEHSSQPDKPNGDKGRPPVGEPERWVEKITRWLGGRR